VIIVAPRDTVFEQQTLQLSAVVLDADSNPIPDARVTWVAQDTAHLKVNQSGVVTGLYFGRGRAPVIAGYHTISDTILIEVAPRPVARITITGPVQMLAAESTTMQTVLWDSAGTILDPRPVRWGTTDSAVLLVAPTGQAFAGSAGSVTLFARSEGASTSVAVNVRELQFITLVGGEGHSCALERDGTPWCWGYNDGGQLGIPGPPFARARPVKADTNHYRSLIAGGHDTCGFTVAGTLVCWGDNRYGQLGEPASSAFQAPKPFSGGPPIVSVTLGGRHSCGLTASSEVYCWGDNTLGQLGTGDSVLHSIPTKVIGGLRFTSVAAGGEHTCAIAQGGALYCWGGFGTALYEPIDWNQCQQVYGGCTAPVAVRAPALVTVQALGGMTCGLDSASGAWCGRGLWFREDSTETFRSITYGYSGFCGITTGGQPVCPSDSYPITHNFTILAATAGGSICGLEGVRVWCWGWNDVNQLGNYEPRSSPIPLLIIGHAR
jgi:hypothetical protein